MISIRSLIPIAMTLFLLSMVVPAGMVEGKPEASFSITATRSYVIPGENNHWQVYLQDEVTFIITQRDATHFTWNFGDGTPLNESSSTTAAHRYAAKGKFMVVLTARNDKDESTRAYGNITVVDRPRAILKVTDQNGIDLAPEYVVKPDQVIILDGSQSTGDITNYVYGTNLPNAFLPQHMTQDPSFSHSYTTAGTYNVGLRVVDRFGNSSQLDRSEFITITVKKAAAENGSGLDLPVPMEYLLGGIAVIILLVVIVVLYQKGYIGAPVMMGKGGSPPPERKDMPPAGGQGPMRTPPPTTFGAGGSGGTPGMLLPKMGPMDMPDPMAGKTVYETKKCPKCAGTIPITSLERPLKVTCPDCGMSFALKGGSGTPPAASQSSSPSSSGAFVPPPAGVTAPPPKQDFVYDVKTCPKCSSKIPITSEERPLKVTCPGCSASFTLKTAAGDKGHPGHSPTSRSPPAPPPPEGKTEVVICPACFKEQAVTAGVAVATCKYCSTKFGL